MLIRPVVSALTAETPPIGCAHVMKGAPERVMCAPHPPAGVMCPECVLEHFAHHPGPPPCCDLCGAQNVPFGVGTFDVPLSTFTVMNTHGTMALLGGGVIATGIAACGTCITSLTPNPPAA